MVNLILTFHIFDEESVIAHLGGRKTQNYVGFRCYICRRLLRLVAYIVL